MSRAIAGGSAVTSLGQLGVGGNGKVFGLGHGLTVSWIDVAIRNRVLARLEFLFELRDIKFEFAVSISRNLLLDLGSGVNSNTHYHVRGSFTDDSGLSGSDGRNGGLR